MKTDEKNQAKAQQQSLAEAQKKAQEARDIRIRSHNVWPVRTRSQAENDFSNLVEELTPTLFLVPFKFANGNVTPDFHRHLGMLIDSMEMLPSRPDHAFDICFRVVDELSQNLTSCGTITDALSGLGTFVCHNLGSSATWKDVIQEISKNLPPVTGRYLAQRLLESFPLAKDPLKSRALGILGQKRYEQFFQKYRTDLPTSTNPIETEHHVSTANNRAGEFLKLLISLRAPYPNATHSAYSELDLSKPSLLFNHSDALNCMLSLLAYTARNERVHGSSLSPFRSSKASLTTYASYYFQFHLLYAISVGLMVESFPGCGASESWLENVKENFSKYALLFKRFSRKA